MARTILVVEDEPTLRETLAEALEADGFRAVQAADGLAALERFRSEQPDLVLLDLMLPELSGLEVTRQIRAESSVPIVMLAARDAELDKVVGLEMGADDYVTKPFSPRELVARVKALLRRAEVPDETPRPIEAGKLTIDPASYRVTRAGKPITLSTLEFRLLYYLAARPNRVFTRDQLLDAVWGTERFVTPRSVDVYVRRLREKIEPDPDQPVCLKTVRGAGYLFETRAA